VAKVWLCRSGIVSQSCGVEPLADRSVSECERILGLQRSDYLCALSEIGQHELPSAPYAHDGGVRVVMGHGTSFAEPEHVILMVDAAEGSDEWQPGVYWLKMISCAEARQRLTNLRP
jgi:hypothetical protein